MDPKEKQTGTAPKDGEVNPKSLTSDGVASLLKSDFAADSDKPAPAQGKEVQPSGGTGTVSPELPAELQAAVETWQQDGGEMPAELQGQLAEFQNGGGELPDELKEFVPAEEPAGGEPVEMPAELQGALEEWQTAGGDLPEELRTQLEAFEQEGGELPDDVKALLHPEAGDDGLPPALQQALDAWDGEGELPAPLQAMVEKRIGKLVAARASEKERADAAEQRAQQLEAELAELQADPNRPAAAPAGPAFTEQTLGQIETASRKLVAEAEAFLDGTADEEEKARVEKYMASERLDEKQLKRRIREVQEYLTAELPQQREQLKQFRAAEAAAAPAAKAHFPFLFDKQAPEYADAQKIVKLMPELRSRTPAHQLAVGLYVLATKIFNHLQAAGEKNVSAKVNAWLGTIKLPAKGAAANRPAKPAVKPPPKPPVAGAAAPSTRVTGKQAAAEQASEKLRTAPTRENAVAALKIGLRNAA